MGKQALDGHRLNAFLMDPYDLIIVGLDTDDGPEHPYYDERVKLKVERADARSVLLYGVLQPVLVKKDEKDRPLVAEGRQRVRWARAAQEIVDKVLEMQKGGADVEAICKKLDLTPAEVKNAIDVESIGVPCVTRRGLEGGDVLGVMITGNAIRKDDPISAKCHKIERMLALGKSEAEVAVAAGVTVQAVKAWLRFDDLSAGVKNAVDNGSCSASAALGLADLPKADQDQKLVEMMKDGKKPTIKRARAASGKDKSERPGKRLLNKVCNKLSGNAKYILAWVLGDLSEEELCRCVPSMREILDDVR